MSSVVNNSLSFTESELEPGTDVDKKNMEAIPKEGEGGRRTGSEDIICNPNTSSEDGLQNRRSYKIVNFNDKNKHNSLNYMCLFIPCLKIKCREIVLILAGFNVKEYLSAVIKNWTLGVFLTFEVSISVYMQLTIISETRVRAANDFCGDYPTWWLSDISSTDTCTSVFNCSGSSIGACSSGHSGLPTIVPSRSGLACGSIDNLLRVRDLASGGTHCGGGLISGLIGSHSGLTCGPIGIPTTCLSGWILTSGPIGSPACYSGNALCILSWLKYTLQPLS